MTNDAELPKPVASKKRKRRAKAAVSEEELASYAYAFEVHRVLNLRYSRRAASTPKSEYAILTRINGFFSLHASNVQTDE